MNTGERRFLREKGEREKERTKRGRKKESEGFIFPQNCRRRKGEVAPRPVGRQKATSVDEPEAEIKFKCACDTYRYRHLHIYRDTSVHNHMSIDRYR